MLGLFSVGPVSSSSPYRSSCKAGPKPIMRSRCAVCNLRAAVERSPSGNKQPCLENHDFSWTLTVGRIHCGGGAVTRKKEGSLCGDPRFQGLRKSANIGSTHHLKKKLVLTSNLNITVFIYIYNGRILGGTKIRDKKSRHLRKLRNTP